MAGTYLLIQYLERRKMHDSKPVPCPVPPKTGDSETPEGRKVFMVTSGEYSDYRVDGIFSTTEKAEEYMARVRSVQTYKEFNGIDVIELDEGLKSTVHTQYLVQIFLKSGDLVGKASSSLVCDKPESRSDIYGDGDSKFVSVRSSLSAEHALKIAGEARQAWLRESKAVTK